MTQRETDHWFQLSEHRSVFTTQTQSRESLCDGRMPPIDLQLIRMRLLNALGCPTRIMMLETTIASLMLGRESARYGLEPIAEFMAFDNRRSVSRLLDESAAWQQTANVSLGKVMRGQRMFGAFTSSFPTD